MARITIKSLREQIDYQARHVEQLEANLDVADEEINSLRAKLEAAYTTIGALGLGMQQRTCDKSPDASGCVEIGKATPERNETTPSAPRYTTRDGRTFEKRVTYHGNRVVTRHVPVSV